MSTTEVPRPTRDNWDPALVDRLAADRQVILPANRGVGASTGVVADNVEDTAGDESRPVADGDNTMMLTENSHLLEPDLPSARLRIYAGGGHGFLDQYPE